MKADLVILHQKKEHLKKGDEFPYPLIDFCKSIDGVAQVIPCYTGAEYWWNPETGSRNRILVIATDLNESMLDVPQIEMHREALMRDKTLLFDRLSRWELGTPQVGDKRRLDSDDFEVVGFFDLGANFTYEGYAFMSIDNYINYMGPHFDYMRHRVDMGFIRLKDPTQLDQVRLELESKLKEYEMIVFTPEECYHREVETVVKKSPSGIIFGIGMVVSFLIGIIICYQLLFNEINDNESQFAVIKAMGYQKMYLYQLVISKSIIFSMVGFLIGLVISLIAYQYIEKSSQIVMTLTFDRGLLVFSVTLIMCLFSAGLAMKRIMKVDPADLY